MVLYNGNVVCFPEVATEFLYIIYMRFLVLKVLAC
jgi:hypothetical protein